MSLFPVISLTSLPTPLHFVQPLNLSTFQPFFLSLECAKYTLTFGSLQALPCAWRALSTDYPCLLQSFVQMSPPRKTSCGHPIPQKSSLTLFYFVIFHGTFHLLSSCIMICYIHCLSSLPAGMFVLWEQSSAFDSWMYPRRVQHSVNICWIKECNTVKIVSARLWWVTGCGRGNVALRVGDEGRKTDTTRFLAYTFGTLFLWK